MNANTQKTGTAGWLLSAGLIVIIITFAGCSTCCLSTELTEVDYTPLAGGDWAVAAPEDQGLDPLSVAKLYCRAGNLDTIYSLLVVKNGYLIAENYFNGGAADRKDRLQSVTKSFTSALVGIALDEGFLDSVSQKMLEFFPDASGIISDPRKAEITIQQMLQMRTGYPSEESDPAYWAGLLSGYYVPLIEGFPLVTDPGTAFHYSNLTSNWLGIIVDRQSGMRLKSFAEKHLFARLGIEAGDWGQDAEGHNNGCADLFLTARDAAKFGKAYLDGGVYNGDEIVPAAWVRDSLKVYSEDAWPIRVGSNFNDIGYGYQWWSVRAGGHRYNLAWGHGGQQIALVHDLGMVIVVTAKPFWLEHNDLSWKYEKQCLNLVADFVASLPAE